MPISKSGTVTTTATQVLTNKEMTNQLITGNGAPPSTPASGKGMLFGVGTSNLRPGWVNEGGTQEVIITNAGSTGLTLGYTAITSTITTTSTSFVQATGLSVTVTVPGTRYVKVTAFINSLSMAAIGTSWISLWDGTVGTGTQIGEAIAVIAGSGYILPVTCVAIVTPASGSKTYNVGWKVNQSTASITATATGPSFILTELA